MLQEVFGDDLLGDLQNIETVDDDQVEAPYLEDNENIDQENNEDGDNEDAVTPIETNPTGVPVDPKKKRTIKRPQPKLNAERLKGPRGIAVIEDVFKDFRFCGKGHEKEDLNQVMKRLEHWAHRLFPRLQFDDCLAKIETLGHKKPVMTYVKKIRLGMVTADDLILPDEVEDEVVNDDIDEPPIDAFDALISQQLSMIESRTSPFKTPTTPTTTKSLPPLTAEQRERMLQNRLLAEQKKLARLKVQHEKENNIDETASFSVTTPSVTSGVEKPLSVNVEHPETESITTSIEPLTSQYEEKECSNKVSSHDVSSGDKEHSSVQVEMARKRTEDDPVTVRLEEENVSNEESHFNVSTCDVVNSDKEQSSTGKEVTACEAVNTMEVSICNSDNLKSNACMLDSAPSLKHAQAHVEHLQVEHYTPEMSLPNAEQSSTSKIVPEIMTSIVEPNDRNNMNAEDALVTESETQMDIEPTVE